VTTDYIGKAGFLSVDQIRALRREGHVIGSHSCSHPARMSACSPEQLRSEWKRSTTVLSDILNEPVTVASIPAGYYSDEVARAADEAGIRALFSSEPQTRTWRVGECSVLGRYCAVADTPPEWAARIVRGDLATRGLAYAGWNAKKLIKKTTAGLWLRFRATVLEGQ
jgi:peptidoglycan/xylan/chitin deacetylase (PgdA/CDA1 family)